MIKEFVDVFTEDLLGLQPDRKVELGKELEEDARPIAKAPYRLAPKEMHKLRIPAA